MNCIAMNCGRFLNYFQPSVKLLERTRVGSRVKRKYDSPKTPFERLIALGVLTPERITAIEEERDDLDRFVLSAKIEAAVGAILQSPLAQFDVPRPLALAPPNPKSRRSSGWRLLTRRPR